MISRPLEDDREVRTVLANGSGCVTICGVVGEVAPFFGIGWGRYMVVEGAEGLRWIGCE